MESVSLEQSATVDELLEACIQAFGSSSHFIRFNQFIHIQSKKVVERRQIWNLADPALMFLPATLPFFDFR